MTLENVLAPAQPVTWPQGKRAAAAFTFDVDAESAVLYAAPGSEHRAGVMSHQAYGPLTGVPRLLKVLDRLGVCSTFFVPGYTAHRYPNVVRDIVAAGHEIAHHGYLHDSTLMDSDHPYELAVAGGRSIVEIPIQWALDDWEQYCFIPDFSGSGLIESPTKVIEIWQLEYEALRDEGGCFVLTNHPFLSGRPSRARALEGLIESVLQDSSVWVASLEEIARHVRGLGLLPRSLPEPTVPAEYRS
jgi:peptidoglycan/xylan/chitin deacetylase (PgdA/CDA1 family)